LRLVNDLEDLLFEFFHVLSSDVWNGRS